MDTEQRWQDRLTFALGLWLFMSPIITNPPVKLDMVTGHSSLMGLAVMFIAGAAIYRYKPWEEWLETVLGGWLIVSPVVLGFTDMTLATINHIVVGAIIVVDSVWVAMKYPRSGHPAH